MTPSGDAPQRSCTARRILQLRAQVLHTPLHPGGDPEEAFVGNSSDNKSRYSTSLYGLGSKHIAAFQVESLRGARFTKWPRRLLMPRELETDFNGSRCRR